MTADIEQRHLSIAELARREGVPVQTVYRWNRYGIGPRYMKVGIYCRYRLADVEQWEETRLVERPGVA
jgi:predicted DNA-binding transcriptional regulator AlpA